MKKLKHSDLVTLYKSGENVDEYIYAEMRSNLMLVAGNHYARRNSRLYDRIRDSNTLSQEQKIRLTKNHIQRIANIYENNILSYAPSVCVAPKNESELQDQKAAELNQAVWLDVKQRHKLRDMTRNFCQDFIQIGECAVKIFWDETKGKLIGYEPQQDDAGNPVMDETGAPLADKGKPRFSGDLVFERIFGFNMFRDQAAKSMSESEFIGIRKMMDVEELKARVGDDPEKLHFIQATRDETYQVFDGQSSGYSETKNKCLVLEMYIRPCANYPKGYYFIYTMAGVLWEGELPFGIFPIVWQGFNEVPTNARCHSIIKQLRPYQAEINRASSKMAEHQITLGDDKLLIQAGTKIQNGGNLPGVRAIQYVGQAPQILNGRAGDQYVQYIQQNIDEMYMIANIAEDNQEKQLQVDPYSMLFASMSQKKKYSIYSSKFERFQIDMCCLALELMKFYASDEMLIPAIGRSEFVNISEFKNTTPIYYQIKLEPGNEDMETKLGKQLMFNQVLQYVGGKLDPQDIGKMIRNSPYANNEESFSDLTLDYDNATNMILALDRGAVVEPSMYDKADYMIKRLINRIRKADFQFLPPQVQENYKVTISKFEDISAAQQQQIQEAALGFIPQSGMAVVCDLYVPDPNNASKTMRARVPYDSLNWLLKRLEDQGTSQQAIMQQQQGVVADIAGKLTANNSQAGGMQ
jgi:hypothetical protein